MGRIQRVKRVNVLLPHIFQRNRLALGVVDQPVFVIFINPGAAAYLEWSRPQANGETISQNMMSHKPHAVRELRRVGGDVLSARILITFIDLEKVVTECIQMLRQPIGIGQGLPFVDGGVISSPAPPSNWNPTRNPCAMQLSNRRTISAKLSQVVRPNREHHSFRTHLFARLEGKTQFNPVAFQMLWFKSLCLAQVLLNLGGPSGIDLIRSSLGVGALAVGLQS